MAFVKLPGSVSLYCSSECYEKDLKPSHDSMAVLFIDRTLVVPSLDTIYNQFHYKLIPRQHMFRTKWTGRKDREAILLWARDIPIYYPHESKPSSSDNAQNIKELTGDAHVRFTVHACVTTLVGVRIYPFVHCLPLTCFCSENSCR